MLSLVQLEDGTFRLVIDYKQNDIIIHATWYFTECEMSEAKQVKEILSCALK